MLRSGLIATKIGNSSFYQNDGTNSHVTVLKVDECIVSNVKTIEKLKEKNPEVTENINKLKNQILYNKENEI